MTATSAPQVCLDVARADRIGIGEAVLCEPKSVAQIATVLHQAGERPMLLTRLGPEQYAALPADLRAHLDYDPSSRTAFHYSPGPAADDGAVAVVTGGTSDVPVALEVVRTLAFHGRQAAEIYDVGVAGLARLERRLPELTTRRVVIAVAGMDAALPTVLAGLVPGLVVAVPTSVGYGVAADGHTALHSLLASCAPGLAVVNIDNGYGAACVALRALR